MRFLPTVGRHDGQRSLPHLTDGVHIASPLIWECTRFCLAPDAEPRVSAALMLAGAEIMGTASASTHFVGVFDARMVRIYRPLGVAPDILGAEGEGRDRDQRGPLGTSSRRCWAGPRLARRGRLGRAVGATGSTARLRRPPREDAPVGLNRVWRAARGDGGRVRGHDRSRAPVLRRSGRSLRHRGRGCCAARAWISRKAPPRPAEVAGLGVLAVVGKAGSGKTMLLCQAGRGAAGRRASRPSRAITRAAGGKDRRTLAILAPTNKAASVLRNHGVPATTIHRILYTPVYDPEYEKIAEWLTGTRRAPGDRGADRRGARPGGRHSTGPSSRSPARWRRRGCRGSDFITGWKRREEPLDIGFVDEASMLDDRQFDDLKEIFPSLVLFGDPAQLAPGEPVGLDGVRRHCRGRARSSCTASTGRTTDNPILDLAHALARPGAELRGLRAHDARTRAAIRASSWRSASMPT